MKICPYKQVQKKVKAKKKSNNLHVLACIPHLLRAELTNHISAH